MNRQRATLDRIMEPGAYVLTTYNGTRHKLDVFAGMAVHHFPAPGRPSSPLDTRTRLSSFDPIRIGDVAVLRWGSGEMWTTSTVLRIVQVRGACIVCTARVRPGCHRCAKCVVDPKWLVGRRGDRRWRAALIRGLGAMDRVRDSAHGWFRWRFRNRK